MEAPAIAWVALVLGAVLLGGGLALLRDAHGAEAAGPESGGADAAMEGCADMLCPRGVQPGSTLSTGVGATVAWAAIGMALVMDVLFLGLTRGGSVLT